MIEIILKNNGNTIWPYGKTKLIYDRNSEIKGDKITLEPQKPGEQKIYYITFKKLENYKVGEHRANLLLEIDDNISGKELIIKVIIKDKKNEIEENIKLIKDFRNNFDLPEEFSDEKLFEILKLNNFNFENAFQSLFD